MDSSNTRETLFAQVLLPLRLKKAFTYRIPYALNAEAMSGKRVLVPFGRNKTLTGVILSVHENAPRHYEAKYILEILDDQPVVTEHQLQLWHWLSAYYLSELGLVMQAALPAGLKLESESKLLLHPDFQWQGEFHQMEKQILQLLEQQIELSISQLNKALKTHKVQSFLRSLYLKGAILIKEDIQQQYKAKKEREIRLNQQMQDDADLHQLFDKLEKRAPRQLEVIMTLFSKGKEDWLRLSDLKALSKSAIQSLIDKGILEERQVEVSRFAQQNEELLQYTLTEPQKKAKAEIKQHFKEGKTSLLHGVTSSGKTLVYMDLIAESLKAGQQVLYLLPEIALTSQLVERLQAFFGDQLLVSHSKFSTNERLEVYYRCLNAEPLLVVGTRSAIFLPMVNLNLIIVDEEHESSYKQFDPAPRFHARDAALYMARLQQADILLGSATPSLESYYNAQSGKFGLVELLERHEQALLPQIEVVSMLEQKRQKRNKGVFSDQLLDMLLKTKEEGNQSILFQNKKGYVPVLECTQCGWTPHCINCDISLTYYKFQNNLRCHYCAYTRPPVDQCPACGHNGLEMIGYGTERIEDELKLYASNLRTDRLDYNNTRRKTAHKGIIDAFGRKEIDVLIGTQMITKGLDFESVQLVGVVNADHLLNFPDFRANERAYQLMTQVAGRAGRRKEQGQVIIQSGRPEHPVLQWVKSSDYQQMYSAELLDREAFGYPPFKRLIKISCKHKDALELHKAVQKVKPVLQSCFGDRILGPEKPYVSKIRNWYIMNFLLKTDNQSSALHKDKALLLKNIDQFEQDKSFKGIRWSLDVDPI